MTFFLTSSSVRLFVKNDGKHEKRRQWTGIHLPGIPGAVFLPEALSKTDGAVRIVRTRNDKFYAKVITATRWCDLPVSPVLEERVVASLDPGVRQFQSYFSPTLGYGAYAFGNDGGYARLFKACLKVDRLEKKIKSTTKRKSRKNLKKSVNKEIERVKHLVKEVHRKVALDLVQKFDCILIPRFSTKKMVRKPKGENEKPRRISKKTARAMLTWSHHQFRMLLSDKAIMTGKEVVTVTEEYTTQACGACGVLNKKIGKYHSLFFVLPSSFV